MSEPSSNLRKTAGVLLVLGSVFLVLSRLSYDPGDIAWFCHRATPVAASNLCGRLGAYTAFLVMLAFGEAYWLLPVLALLLSYKAMHLGELHIIRFLHGTVLGLATLSVVIFIAVEGVPDWAPSYGGFFGAYYGEILVGNLGLAGSWLVVAGCLFMVWTCMDMNEAAKRLLSHPEKKIDIQMASSGGKGKGSGLLVEPERVLPHRKDEDEEHGAAASARKKAPAAGRDGEKVRLHREKSEYKLPPDSILDEAVQSEQDSPELLLRRAKQLEEMFGTFHIGVKVVGMKCGPTITQFELEVEEGIRLSKITSLSDNVALTLKAPSVRILAPIPGKNTVGIEIPNILKELVNLRSVIDHPEYKVKVSRMTLPLILGKDVAGTPLIEDLAKMPHLLVAGTTGSGKSVCMNSIIVSMLLHHTPDSVRLILIDPKMVEMSGYKEIPHLLTPVVTDIMQAAPILEWACWKMDRRYQTLCQYQVKEARAFNKLSKGKIREGLAPGQAIEDIEWPMPYLVILIDEFGDLMVVGRKEIESFIMRLAQKSRAVGIHVILATQRPSADIITGVIKANMPTRVAFQVAAKIDSRIILDQQDLDGADKLMGSGDMLFRPPGKGNLFRAQGVFVSDKEISRVVEHWKEQGAPDFVEIELPMGHKSILGGMGGGSSSGGSSTEDEELYPEAVSVVLESGRPTTSFIQRQLGVGYNKASRLIEMMEERGVVSPANRSKEREILVSQAQWDSQSGAAGRPAPGGADA